MSIITLSTDSFPIPATVPLRLSRKQERRQLARALRLRDRRRRLDALNAAIPRLNVVVAVTAATMTTSVVAEVLIKVALS